MHTKKANDPNPNSRYPYLRILVEPPHVDPLSTLLFEFGATGVECRDQSTLLRSEGDEVQLIAHFEAEQSALLVLQMLSDRFPTELLFIEGDGWRDEWKKFFKVLKVGRIVIQPSWLEYQPTSDEVVVHLDPGNAFGSGLHETTRLVLRSLDQLSAEAETGLSGVRVLDAGCGSGILSIAAMKLGADAVVGIDIDEDAVRVAKENASINNIKGDFSADDMSKLHGCFDVIVANIRTEVLVTMVADFQQRLSRNGTVVLSGILAAEEAEIMNAFSAWELVEKTQEGDWIACRMTI